MFLAPGRRVHQLIRHCLQVNRTTGQNFLQVNLATGPVIQTDYPNSPVYLHAGIASSPVYLHAGIVGLPGGHNNTLKTGLVLTVYRDIFSVRVNSE